MMDEARVREIAREEALRIRLASTKGEKKGWYYHLTIYIIVNAIFSVYALAVGDPFWPIYPIVFWGAGVSVHGVGVFGAL